MTFLCIPDTLSLRFLNNKKNIMKKYLIYLLLISPSIFFISCKKEKESGSDKLNEIISKEHRSALANLGMDINDGTTPPNIVGSVYMSPNYLLKSNINGDPAPNTQFVHYTIKFYDQNTSGNTVKFSGVGSGGSSTEREESQSGVVTGSGNSFTVYGRSTVTIGANSIVVAYVYSGIIEGQIIKNFKKALVVVDDSKGGSNLIKNGDIRVFYDANRTSELTR